MAKIRTRRQKIENNRNNYSVPAYDADNSVPVFIPVDESGTKKLFDIGDFNVDKDFDFVQTTAKQDGTPPLTLTFSGNLTETVLPINTASNHSMAIMALFRPGAVATWSQFKLGTADGSTGSFDIQPGNVVITKITGTAVTISYTTSAVSGTDIAVLFTWNQDDQVMNVYEAGVGEDWTLKDTDDGTALGQITLAATTPLIINNSVASGFWGAAQFKLLLADPASADYLEAFKTMKDNWFANDFSIELP